jgi:hypothetical protein
VLPHACGTSAQFCMLLQDISCFGTVSRALKQFCLLLHTLFLGGRTPTFGEAVTHFQGAVANFGGRLHTFVYVNALLLFYLLTCFVILIYALFTHLLSLFGIFPMSTLAFNKLSQLLTNFLSF